VPGARVQLRPGRAVTPPVPRTGLAPFRIRSFRFQWPSDLIASWALEMETLILGWYVLTETGSVSLLVLFGALQYLGSLVAPVFGVAGDRIGHRTLLFASRALYTCLATLIMVLSFTGALTPLIVLIISSIAGMVRPSDLVMRNALIAQTVPPAQLMGALGISRTTSDSARIAGALAGAGSVAALGIGWTYVMVASLYVVSFGLSLGVAGRPPRTTEQREATRRTQVTPWKDLVQAFVYMWDKPALLGAMFLAFLVNALAYPFVLGLLPYVAKNIYGIGQIGLGYLVASFSLGGMIGSILLTVIRIPVRASRTMIVSSAIWFVLLLAFSWVTNIWLGVLTLFLSGLAQSICLTPLAAVMLRGAGDEYRGRIMGMRMLAIWGLPGGLLIAGPLIGSIGFAMTGTLYALVGLALMLFMVLRWHAALWPVDAPSNIRA